MPKDPDPRPHKREEMRKDKAEEREIPALSEDEVNLKYGLGGKPTEPGLLKRPANEEPE